MIGLIFDCAFFALLVLVSISTKIKFDKSLIINYLVLVIGILDVKLLHELAHYIIAKWYGLNVVGVTVGLNITQIELGPYEYTKPGYVQMILAGPVINLILYFVLYVLLKKYKITRFEPVFAGIASFSIYTFAKNAIPLVANDGAKALYLTVATVYPRVADLYIANLLALKDPSLIFVTVLGFFSYTIALWFVYGKKLLSK